MTRVLPNGSSVSAQDWRDRGQALKPPVKMAVFILVFDPGTSLLMQFSRVTFALACWV